MKLWTRDIMKVSVAEVKRTLGLKTGELDLLAGCPPCQGFSTMRSLNGGKRIIDKQNDLLFQFLRFVRRLKPRVIMMENVPRLAENHRVREFARAVRVLGYSCEYRVVNAARYGVPQRRRRMILLASRVGLVPFANEIEKLVTVADTIGHLPAPGTSGDPLHDLPERRSEHVQDLIRHIPKDGGSRKDAPPRFTLRCHLDHDGFYDVYGRMSWNDVAPTITGGCHNPSKGRFLHPSQDRTITLREAALLQSFPQRYHFSLKQGKEHAALLIGNALPPTLIRKFALPIAKRLRQARAEGSGNLI